MERQAGRYRQGGSEGEDTRELFDDLEYSLLLREYPQKCMPLLDFKGRALRPRRISFQEIGESGSE
jgi:hypothetical protein